jgi:hypothetical protein
MSETEPSAPDFLRLLAWAYRGELSGESMFGALADAWSGEPRGEKLRTLQELEGRMAEALLPLLRDWSVEGGDDERSRQTGRDNAAGLTGNSWESFLKMFGPATTDALQKYHRLLRLSPDRDNVVLKQLIAHEEALSLDPPIDLGRCALFGPGGVERCQSVVGGTWGRVEPEVSLQ